jgi:hypothetical protein
MDVSSKNVSAVLLSLQMDIMAREDQLEQSINTKGDLEHKIFEIKNRLKELIVAEQMLKKFQSLIVENAKPVNE